ncbi:MAG: general stress protein [Pseudomonadota bacterium]
MATQQNQTGRNQRGQFTAGSPAAKQAGHKGGQASSGSFEKGSERAREAGRKGGSNSHRGRQS